MNDPIVPKFDNSYSHLNLLVDVKSHEFWSFINNWKSFNRINVILSIPINYQLFSIKTGLIVYNKMSSMSKLFKIQSKSTPAFWNSNYVFKIIIPDNNA